MEQQQTATAADRLPLSAAQYGIWLGQQLDPASPAYLTAEAIELRGALDEAAFLAAVRRTLDRCEALHMRYRSDGESVWQTHEPRHDWPLPCPDLSAAASPWQAAQDWMSADLAQPVDLADGPLFATALLRLGPERHLWYLRIHHVACDGFGYTLLSRRVAALYAALRQGVAAPADPEWRLAPVVEEDRRYQESAAAERDRAFWLAQASDTPAPFTLAPPATIAHTVRRRHGALTPALQARWQEAAAAAGVDWAAWLIAAIAAWLHREGGTRELTLGLPVMGRLGSVALTIPCMAMNIVPLHLRVDPAGSLSDLARHTAAAMKALRPHQRYRYERLRHDLGLVGSSRRLFGPVINLMPFDRPLDFGGLEALSHPVSAGPVEDLSITVAVRADGIRLDFEANPDAYDAARLDQARETLIEALDRLTAAPDRPIGDVLGAAAPAAQALLAGESLPGRPARVLDLLTAHALTSPNRIALEQDGEPALSYGELLAQVQALAGRLHAHGVKADDRVGILLPRSSDSVIALLATLWAGAGYLPLDPEGPTTRLAALLEDAKPALVLTRRDQAARLPQGVAHWCLDEAAPAAKPLELAVPVDDSALAYVIYTSGSTGKPNGVMLGRDALAHFVAGAGARYQMRADDRMLQFAPLHFDASVEEIFLPLCHGATVVLRTEAMLESLPRFIAACARLRISVLDLPTAFWHELTYSLGSHDAYLSDSIRLVIIGGEAALAERVARWRSAAPASTVLLNTYGPTETTVICTTAELAGPQAIDWQGDSVPIGRPLPGLTVAVVDESLRPVAPGMPGELCLLGGALARGYLGRDALTATRFVQLHALPDAPRAYRTGDRVLLDGQGQLRYLGRLDDEFKISGHRVDPSEVETALLAYPGIREAAVVGLTQPGGLKRLVGFLVGDATDPAPLRAFLAERLPAAAVPSQLLWLERLPRNANNKIDRGALRQLPLDDEDEAIVATELEHAVMAVWREVLGCGRLGPEADFFALGGRSLQAIQVANRLSTRLGREVPMSSLFRHPTVAALAQSLGTTTGRKPPTEESGAEFAPLLTIQEGEGRPLFCIHPAEGLSWCYLGLANSLPGLAIHALQARGLSGALPDSFEAMAGDYLAQIRTIQPEGPYRLLGWSAGGAVAQAMAVQLRAAGEAVELLALLDSYPSIAWQHRPAPARREALEALLDVVGDPPIGADGQALTEPEILARLRRPGSPLAGFDAARIENLTEVALHTMRLFRTAEAKHFDGDLLLFRALRRPASAPDWEQWTPYIGGQIERIDIDSSHAGMTQAAPLARIGRLLAERLGCSA
ncbi:amino acid adenylation domain-containing protein [Chitinimonas lacunae]|uniref:Amino acid adenylation domain-containing protein n=1 Tax=Chitinimonas lacunae TaxID=1963018 RepID=A0ABV8MLZ6_9NEIS